MLKRLRDTEDGFTLIELLVVVIIIGILAAIAIPTFLSQRERGWQAELTSAVRNSALEIEAEATALNGAYPLTAVGQPLVTPFGVREGDDITLTYTGAADAFDICGVHPQITGAHSQTYASGTAGASGGLQPFDGANGC